MAQSLRLAVIAILSALTTATLVIGGGQALLGRQQRVDPAASAVDSSLLMRTRD